MIIARPKTSTSTMRKIGRSGERAGTGAGPYHDARTGAFRRLASSSSVHFGVASHLLLDFAAECLSRRLERLEAALDECCDEQRVGGRAERHGGRKGEK